MVDVASVAATTNGSVDKASGGAVAGSSASPHVASAVIESSVGRVPPIEAAATSARSRVQSDVAPFDEIDVEFVCCPFPDFVMTFTPPVDAGMGTRGRSHCLLIARGRQP